jgi:hypothetical protein
MKNRAIVFGGITNYRFFVCSLFVLCVFCFSGCNTSKGVFIPFVGTSYNYSYLNSLEGGKLVEPLREVTIKDESAAIKLYGSVDEAKTFESYFPDDIEGGKELDRWWNSAMKTLRSDKDIIRTIRYGFRRTKQDKTQIIRWVSKRYGTPRNFLNKYSLKGYWLMYYASFSPEKNVRSSAVHYGIGRHRGGDAGKIYKRLVQLAIADEHVEIAIKKARNGDRQSFLMLESLEPYLSSSNSEVRQKAFALQSYFRGESNFNKKT